MNCSVVGQFSGIDFEFRVMNENKTYKVKKEYFNSDN